MAVQLGHDLCRVGTLHRQVETRDFLVIAGIQDAAIGVFHLREVLASKAVDGEDQAFHVRRHFRQIDIDLFVVAIARARAVVARVDNAAVLAFQLAEPDDVGRALVLVEHDARGIEVDRFGLRTETEETLGLGRIPAQAHGDTGQGGTSFFVQRNLLALAQIDRHTHCSCLVGYINYVLRRLALGPGEEGRAIARAYEDFPRA